MRFAAFKRWLRRCWPSTADAVAAERVACAKVCADLWEYKESFADECAIAIMRRHTRRKTMIPEEELKILKADWAALVAQVTDPTLAIWAERDAAGALLRRLNDAIQAERDAAVALLRRLNDAVEALDGTNVENEKLVDDYRALIKRLTP
jgi:pimeloyl-ACP methyl ester carboxylesterase